MDIVRFRDQLIEAYELNQWFIERGYDDHMDLDTIAMYLAVDLNCKIIPEEYVEKIPVLIRQIANALEKLFNEFEEREV